MIVSKRVMYMLVYRVEKYKVPAAGVESRGVVSRKIRGFAYIIMKYLPLISAHLSFRSSYL